MTEIARRPAGYSQKLAHSKAPERLSLASAEYASDDNAIGHSRAGYSVLSGSRALRSEIVRRDLALVRNIDTAISRQAPVSGRVDASRSVDCTAIAASAPEFSMLSQPRIKHHLMQAFCSRNRVSPAFRRLPGRRTSPRTKHNSPSLEGGQIK